MDEPKSKLLKWFLKPVMNEMELYEEPVSSQMDTVKQEFDYSDSAFYPSSKDTVFVLQEPTERVIYVKEEKGSIIGLSNEIITLLVGLMNLVVMGIQLKNKK